MDKSKNAIRSEQLGMSFGKANNILKKSIMFSLIQKCSMDNCFLCGERIKSVDEMSIEHKTPWLRSENPLEMFFDLDNIAFSHLKCNVSSKRRPDVENCLKIDNSGSKHGRSKLTDEDVIEIRRLLSTGMTQSQVAAMYGMSKSGIGYVKTGWTHLK